MSILYSNVLCGWNLETVIKCEKINLKINFMWILKKGDVKTNGNYNRNNINFDKITNE